MPTESTLFPIEVEPSPVVPVPWRCLTLWQPWASLIVIGAKIHETRSWATSHRGPLLIHASARWHPKLGPAAVREFNEKQLIPNGFPPLPETLPLGAVVALATLADCRHTCARPTPDPLNRACGDWSPGRWAWRLVDVRPLRRPVSWKGHQGLWMASDELVRLVTKEVGDGD